MPDKLKDPAASSWINWGQDHITVNRKSWNWFEFLALKTAELKLYLIDSKIEASKDNSTTCHSSKTCLLAKNEICEEDVKHCGQAPSDVVERDANVPKTQVVECDHPDEDNGEGKHLNFVKLICCRYFGLFGYLLQYGGIDGKFWKRD